MRTLSRGMKGDDVATLQTRLNQGGFSAGTADGIFGAKTEAAVKAFQAARGLNVDGIVGPATWGALGIVGPPAPSPEQIAASPASEPSDVAQAMSPAQKQSSASALNAAMPQLIALAPQFAGILTTMGKTVQDNPELLGPALLALENAPFVPDSLKKQIKATLGQGAKSAPPDKPPSRAPAADPGFPWEIVIGGAAVAGGLAVLAGVLRARRKGRRAA